ncbi:hypothetical protein CVT24_001107 [Panaeolus cyanescens]|uniref:Uncharacterized protein n=1 Tax=Panaeolus cyanescens TaxID=181874 RepID=A0A409W6U6_9AGAR|nr:hypothetical protein CVT24_001107 [Panaeolus cyanescens]
MARRSAPSAQPSYISHPGARGGDSDESAFSRFWRTEVVAADKLPGNISIASAVGLFVGGIIAIRTWGDLMVPAT